jgi:MFS family permease
MQSFHDNQGLAGWQWMFLIEAIPAVAIGIATILYLDNGIANAKWISEREKRLLTDDIAAQQQEKTPTHSVGAVFRDLRTWWMSLIYFAFVTGQYGLTFWMSTLVKSTGVTGSFDIGLLSAIPFLFAIVMKHSGPRFGPVARTSLASDRAGAVRSDRLYGCRLVCTQYGGVDRVPVARGGGRTELRAAVLVVADGVHVRCHSGS